MTTQTKLPIDELKQFEQTDDKQLIDLTANLDEAAQSFFTETPEPTEEIPTKKERKKREPKNPPRVPTPEPVNLFNDDEFSTATATPENTKITLDKVVTGKVLINTFDKLMCLVLPLGLNAAGIKLKPSEISLTNEEKKTLETVVTECAKTLPINFSNPWVALATCVIAIYGNKVVEKISFNDDNFSDNVSGESGSLKGAPKPHHSDKKAYQKWYRDNKK